MTSRMPVVIGIIAGLPVYGSVFLDKYMQFVIEGIRAAALNNGCSLLAACGVRRTPGARSLNCAWPVPAPDSDYLPVGPWNTGGLIVFTPLRSRERSRYIQRLRKENFPVVFIGGGEEGPSVMIDNENGIHQAVEHLVRHGHRRIAYVAGEEGDSGDSAQRLQAFHHEAREFRLDVDPRLVAHGNHQYEGGRRAMEQILMSSAPFTAVVASNDTSAFGVMDALREAGRRIPGDVAVVGFDDQPATVGQVPPLTSVHYPLYEIGVRAIQILLAQLQTPESTPLPVRIPAWLAVRESCGCPKSIPAVRPLRRVQPAPIRQEVEPLAAALVAALSPDTRRLSRGIVQAHCRRLAETFLGSMEANDPAFFDATLQEVLQTVEAMEENCETWQAAISELRERTIPLLKDEQLWLAEDMLHHARLALVECAERQNQRRNMLLRQASQQISWMSTRMYSAQDELEFLGILEETLPSIGIRFAQVAFYEKKGDNPYGGLRFFTWNHDEKSGDVREMCCASMEYPPQDVIGEGLPFALALLPLAFQAKPIGFVAFDAANLEPLGTIIRQIAAPLRNLRLKNRIWDLSLVDGRLGISNRRFFDLQLGRETARSLRYKRGLALLFLECKEGPEQGSASRLAQWDAWLHAFLGEGGRTYPYVCRFDRHRVGIILPEVGTRGLQDAADGVRLHLMKSKPEASSIAVLLGGAASDASVEDPVQLVECAEHAVNEARVNPDGMVLLPIDSDPDTRRKAYVSMKEGRNLP
jgi:hypothetical protein